MRMWEWWSRVKTNVGKFGLGMRIGEGRELVVRNGMAIAGSFFQKWKTHKIYLLKWIALNRTGFGCGKKATVVEGSRL